MVEMLKGIQDNYLIIAAIASFIYWHYKQERKKYDIWKDLYFEEILVKFHNKHVKSTDMNMKRFINKYNFSNSAFIPGYVIYLAKNKAYESLKEALVVDYENNYPCKRKVSSKSQSKMGDFIYFCFEIMIYLLVSIFIFIVLFTAIVTLVEFISGSLDTSKIITYLIYIVVSISMAAASIFLLRTTDGIDDYTSNTVEINKIIANRKETYNKIADGLFYIGYK